MEAQTFELDAASPVAGISEAVIKAFEEDGVVMLRGALAPEWLMLIEMGLGRVLACLLYTSPSPRDVEESRMPSSA